VSRRSAATRSRAPTYQRLLTAKTDKKGDWNVRGIKSGVWLFEVAAAAAIVALG
jgi:hypothetical protein